MDNEGGYYARAEQMGVKQIYIDDLREEFVRDYVFPMFRANAVYEGTYLLGTSIARPLIAKQGRTSYIQAVLNLINSYYIYFIDNHQLKTHILPQLIRLKLRIQINV